MSQATDSQTGDQRQRLRTWLQRNDRELSNQAVADVENTEAIREAVKGGDHADVSPTQLQALQNTAKMCAFPDLTEYIDKRKNRRADTNEEASAFWDELLGALRTVRDEIAPEAIEACDAPETTPTTVEAGTLDQRAVETLVARRYLTHFVAHCQYLQRL
jgi:hypothetical protein